MDSLSDFGSIVDFSVLDHQFMRLRNALDSIPEVSTMETDTKSYAECLAVEVAPLDYESRIGMKVRVLAHKLDEAVFQAASFWTEETGDISYVMELPRRYHHRYFSRKMKT